MDKIGIVILMISLLLLFGSIELLSCIDEDEKSTRIDPADISTPTCTPQERTPIITPTPTPTPEDEKLKITFFKKYGTDFSDYGYAVQQTDDKGYIIVGNTYVSGIGDGVYLIKIDPVGNLLWSQSFAQQNYSNWGRSVQQTSDGGYIIVGGSSRQYHPGEVGYWIYLIKTDENGNELWSKKFANYSETGESSVCENPLKSTKANQIAVVYTGDSVQQTYDGGYVITGIADGSMGDKLNLVKTDSSGNVLWARKFKGNSRAWGQSVRQAIDGGYVVVGSTMTQFSDHDFSEDVYFLKTDSEGNLLWSRTFGGLGYDSGNSVQLTDDGGYIIAGSTTSFSQSNQSIYLIKANGDGNELWSTVLGGSENCFGYSVDLSGDGGYTITGYISTQQNTDVYLVKTDACGTGLWSRRYGGDKIDQGTSLQQTADGGYVITGFTFSDTGYCPDAFVLKTDENGNISE